MGLINNLITQLKGILNDAVDNISDPSRTVRQILRDLDEQIKEAKNKMVDVMAEYELLRSNYEEADSKAKEWHENAKKALLANREDLAKKALEEEQKYEEKAKSYKEQIDKLEPTIKELKAKIEELEKKREELNSKAEILGARYEVAKAQEKASEIFSDIGSSDAYQKLNSVEEKVKKQEAKAKVISNISDESSGKSLEDEFKELDKTKTVDEKLEELKKELQK